MIVVDANVSLKWFLPEYGMAEAFSLLRSGRKLVGPWIIRDEVVSGLVRRVRRKELAAKEARACVADWMQELRRETVHLINEESLLTDAAEMGFELKHPLFDCIYLALAEHLGAPLVTADKTFYQRAKKLSQNVCLLADVDQMLAA